MMELDRRRFLKFLSAAGVAIAARIGGLMPEAQLLASAQGRPSNAQRPWYAQKAVSQTELLGAARDAAIAHMQASTDFRNLAATLVQRPSTLQNTLAVESVYADGSKVLGVGGLIDDQHVVLHFEQLGKSSPRTITRAYSVDAAKGAATLIGGSADGVLALSHVPSSALTAATCYGHWCTSCCGYDLKGLEECCGGCVLTCFGGPVLCILCVGIWCQFCLYWHCNQWCSQCLPYRVPCA